MIIDSVTYTGWFASDFTLAEIKQLRAVQSRAPRSTKFDGAFEVPTLQEVIDLAKRESARDRADDRHLSGDQALDPGTLSQGLPIEDSLVATLNAAGWRNKTAPVIIQSFEIGNLKLCVRQDRRAARAAVVRLRQRHQHRPADLSAEGSGQRAVGLDSTNDPRTYADMLTPAGLAEIATYADGIGPWKRQFVGVKGIDRNGDGKADDLNGDGSVNEADGVTEVFSTLIADAHRAGLVVHAYTFRDDVPVARDFAATPSRNIGNCSRWGWTACSAIFPTPLSRPAKRSQPAR